MMNEGALHELPGGWVWTRLGEIGTINPKLNGNVIRDNTEVTFLPMRCVEELTGHFDLSLTKRISEVKKGYTPFIDGDLLFAKITPCMENGKIAIVQNLKNGIGFGSTEFHVIRVPDMLPRRFFFYFLIREELRRDAQRNMTGSAGQLRVPSNYMQQILLPLPPLPEQRAIVSKIEQLFSDLDNGIENFKKAQAQLKLYRQSVLKAACEGKLVPTEAELARAEGRDYEAADVLLARILRERREKWNGKGKYKETEAPDVIGMPALPDGWIWVNIDQLSEVIRGASPRPAGDPRYFGGNIPWITVGEITKDKKIYLTSVENFVTEEGKKASRFIEEGTFLLTNSGATLGVPKITLISGCINDGSVALLGLDDILKLYLYFFLFTQTNKLRQINQGAAQPNLNTTIVKRIILPLPPLAEQRRIVAEVERRLSVSDKMEATITESLQKAEALRQSILKKAFEGKLLNERELEKARNASDWEPAEKLLERIRKEKARTTGEKKRKR